MKRFRKILEHYTAGSLWEHRAVKHILVILTETGIRFPASMLMGKMQVTEDYLVMSAQVEASMTLPLRTV